jgi:hypothetical protein
MRVDDCEVLQAAVDAACEEFEKRFPVPLDGSFRLGVEAVLAAALAAMPESDAQVQIEALRAGADELLLYCERHQCHDIARGLRALLKPATPGPQAAPLQSTPPVVQPGEALVRAEALAQVYALLDVLAQSYADYLGCRARGAANKDSARGMLDSFVARWCATRGPA